jgi:putative inorganic carbon (hco3(-)) transporter
MAAIDRRLPWRVPWYLWIAVGLVLVVALHVRAPGLLRGDHLFVVIPGLAFVLLVGAILWELPPAVMACGAIALTLFSGNWTAMGLPGFPFVPDRVLLAGALLALLLRSPGTVGLPPIRVRGVHLLMLVTVLYVAASGVVDGQIGMNSKSSVFALLDQVGAVPFLLLLVAPVIFSGPRERGWLLATLVGIGAYLGLTAIFETIGPHALVFPRYIYSVDLSRGIGQATGPFSAVVTEGFACYACAIASIIAALQWRGGWRWVALGVVLVSLLGSFMSLERGVWLGAVAGGLAVAVAAREVRRWLIPGAIACVVLIGGAVTLFPALSAATTKRVNSLYSVWDRENQTSAALRMIQAKPLTGFGWNNYVDTALPYFRQSPNYPLVGYPSSLNPQALGGSSRTRNPATGRAVSVGLTSLSLGLHDTYLEYGVELGLVGASLWLASVLWGLGGAIFGRGSPELRPWRLGLLAMTVCYLVIAAVDPLDQNFTQVLLWTWAGVAGASAGAGAVVTIPAPRRDAHSNGTPERSLELSTSK